MRLNQYIALATGVSRRKADDVIAAGLVRVNEQPATLGQRVTESDEIAVRGKTVPLPVFTTIMLNKPAGYVCSRKGQGNKTIYELLPPGLHHLKPIGRLDKDSSGLLLLTNDGHLAQLLSHPSEKKNKIYAVTLDKPLAAPDKQVIVKGVLLADGPSQLQLDGKGTTWTITMHEGRNRQIRRTFETRGYHVLRLHRLAFGSYTLGDVPSGKYQENIVK